MAYEENMVLQIWSPILEACINNQQERLTSVIINFRDVNSNDKKKQLVVDSPKFLQLFFPQ